jgi:small-conductance mechanosensitive channel/CRP-like cAMP-binding protein
MMIDPLYLAAGVMVGGFLASRYWKNSRPLAHFLLQFLAFVVFTGLIVAGGVVPYHPAAPTGAPASRRLLVAALGVVWWISVAWFAVGFLRTFVWMGRRSHESRLAQDLLAGLVYVAVTFAIIADVFDLPLQGLLATSGALAIILGLALQSSLGDVFSGIVLDLERPYRVGDWIVIDDGIQGSVIETNWRATHILTASQDVAVIPNSVIAKAKIVNRSSPTRVHSVSIRVRLQPVLMPEEGRAMLKDVLLVSTNILRTPEPAVSIQDVSDEMIDYELSYSVPDLDGVDRARNEIFDRVYGAATANGLRFAPRLGGAPARRVSRRATRPLEQRLLEGIALFSHLTAQEKTALCPQMRRRSYVQGQVLVNSGATLRALGIISRGVLVASVEQHGHKVELIRLGPGEYFGEHALLTGEPLQVEISALTPAVIYEVPLDALAPLIKTRPELAAQLSETLARRRELALQTSSDAETDPPQHYHTRILRLTNNIRQLFGLH